MIATTIRRATVLLAAAGIAAGAAVAAPARSAEDMPGMSSGMKELTKTTWQGMRIAVAAATPAQTFSAWVGTGQRTIKPRKGENAHLMIVLSDAKTGERIPYASVTVTLTDARGKVVYSGRQWPMLSPGMGMHYGNNVAMAAHGTYRIRLVIGPPAVGRHVEYGKVWTAAHTVSATFEWMGGM